MEKHLIFSLKNTNFYDELDFLSFMGDKKEENR